MKICVLRPKSQLEHCELWEPLRAVIQFFSENIFGNSHCRLVWKTLDMNEMIFAESSLQGFFRECFSIEIQEEDFFDFFYAILLYVVSFISKSNTICVQY